jgi:two-component system response regulator MprA
MNEQTGSRVAVVDDEVHLRDVLEIGLAQEGFLVRTAPDGIAGLTLVRDWNPECVVLDLMMPKLDGISMVPMIRRLSQVPIIMLTARGDFKDRIEGLAAGADDYMAKPFDLGELAARLRSALRRPLLKQVTTLRYADLILDLEERSAQRGSRSIRFSKREFDIVATLMRQPQRVFTRDELLGFVWGTDRNVGSTSVQTYMSYIRAKLDCSSEPRLLHTIRGVGYSIRSEKF